MQNPNQTPFFGENVFLLELLIAVAEASLNFVFNYPVKLPSWRRKLSSWQH
jgi:hypothetical protein